MEMSKLLDVPVENLHFIYGVNCFQFAMGIETPIIMREVVDGTAFVEYVAMSPGNPSLLVQEQKICHGSDAKIAEIQKFILDGCVEDGLVVCGRELVQREGHRNIAVLFTPEGDPRFDFHFVRQNAEGKWESKIPMTGVDVYDDIEAVEKDTRYKFHSYLSVPEGAQPTCMKVWPLTSIKVQSPSGETRELLEIKQSADDDMTIGIRNTVVINPVSPLTRTVKPKADVLNPLWPPVGEAGPQAPTLDVNNVEAKFMVMQEYLEQLMGRLGARPMMREPVPEMGMISSFGMGMECVPSWLGLRPYPEGQLARREWPVATTRKVREILPHSTDTAVLRDDAAIQNLLKRLGGRPKLGRS